MPKSTFKKSWTVLFACLVFSLRTITGLAQETDSPDANSEDSDDIHWQKAWDSMIQGKGNRWNLELPTLGGKQFWTDYRWWRGYRIQYNHTLDHWRLLDPSAVRKGWGTKEAMLELLDQIKSKENSNQQDGTEKAVTTRV